MLAAPRTRRLAAAALCAVSASTLLVATATPAAAEADESCSADGVNDTVNSSTGQRESFPAADIYSKCIASDGTTVRLSATVAPGSPPMSDPARLGQTTMRWNVATQTENLSPVDYVVAADPYMVKVFTAEGFSSGASPICSSTQPMADEIGFRTALAASCFPGAATLVGTPFLSFDGDASDPGSPLYLDGSDGSETGRIYNGLSRVDRRYVDMGGSRSTLGSPVSANELGQLGTTERRQYQRGIISHSVDLGPIAREVVGPTYDKYRSLGQERSELGRPTSGQQVISVPENLSHDNTVNLFERGAIYSSVVGGAHEVHGAIFARHGVPSGLFGGSTIQGLGFPLTDETATSDGVGRYNHFERGSIYWSPTTGAHPVQSPMLEVWARLGRERGALGYPMSSQLSTADFRGWYEEFQGGSIYAITGGAGREVHGAIRGTWLQLGGVRSALAYPTTDELGTPDGRGRFNHFESGSIYWTPTTGAREARGAIRESWARRGWERGPVGYPTTNELTTPDGRGRYNHFESGSIYWTPSTGAQEVRGAIRETWARPQFNPYAPGWERGPLGYPKSDELATPDGIGRYNHFEGGSIYWTPRTGANAVRGALGAYWASTGSERGPLGYPVTNEQQSPGGRYQQFEKGTLFWDAGTGQVRRS